MQNKLLLNGVIVGYIISVFFDIFRVDAGIVIRVYSLTKLDCVPWQGGDSERKYLQCMAQRDQG